MGEVVERGVIARVQQHVDCILLRLGLVATGFQSKVGRMGSREYGCAVLSSDLDLYFLIPFPWLIHAKTIRVLLGSALESAEQAMGGHDAPADQEDNSTLKWTCTLCRLDVSLLVAAEDVVMGALSATMCLAWHFAGDRTLQVIVREVLSHLRSNGVLNSHGRKAIVNQSLKTTPAALLCVALMRFMPYDRWASTDVQCQWLLLALSTFDGSACSVSYDWSEERCFCVIGPYVNYSHCPLRIMRGWRNSANRLTLPYWAKFQYVCHLLSRYSAVPPFMSFLGRGDTVDCTPLGNSSRHVRLHLPDTWDCVNRQEDFAVVSVWAGSGAGTLLVASGVGNETDHNFDGYRYIVVVTWCKGYSSNPAWFPALLISVANSLCKPHGERMDVFGLSRGAQAVICCFDVALGLVDAAADILNNLVLVGGCIWERGDHALPGRILEGLAHVERIWFRSPLRAVVVSEMDLSVRKRGETSANGRGGYRVDYADFSEQVRNYTQQLLVLDFAGHAVVLSVGASITAALKLSPTSSVREEVHLTCGDLEEALMRLGDVPPRVVGDSEGSPWLIPGQQTREGAEAAVAPRLTSRDAGLQSARRVRPCVFKNRLKSCGYLPRDMEKELQIDMKDQLRGHHLSWVFGGTGVGKSRRAPPAAMMSLEGDLPRGVLHVLPRKLASYSLLDFYVESEYEVVRNMASIWHGDVKEMPTQREFVVFSTPVSAYHRLRTASSWQDLSFIVFDEIQVKDGLMALCILYVLDLIVRGAPLAKGVRVLLMTATPYGPAYSMLKDALDLMSVRMGSVTVLPCTNWSTFTRRQLWEVVARPENWHCLSHHAKIIKALILMTEWLWVHYHQSASILIFVAGECEVSGLRNAIFFFERTKGRSLEVPCTGVMGALPME